MKTKINLFTYFLALLFTFSSTNLTFAAKINVTATGKITGNISCANTSKVLQNVNITLFSASDSSLVAGTISDNFGNFYFSMLGTGQYYVIINNSGFTDYRITGLKIEQEAPKLDLGEIKLNPKEKSAKKYRGNH